MYLETFNIDAWRNEEGEIERLVVDGVELDLSDIVEFKLEVGTVGNISVLLAELDDLAKNVEDTNGRTRAINQMRDLVDGLLAAIADSEKEERTKGKVIPFPYDD